MSYEIRGKTINGIVPTEAQVLKLNSGTGTIKLTLKYRPAIQMWFMDISYNGIDINGLRVCLGLNLLRQWKNILDFGILVKGIIEPMFIDDFSTGRVTMMLLNTDEVQTIEDFFKEGV